MLIFQTKFLTLAQVFLNTVQVNCLLVCVGSHLCVASILSTREDILASGRGIDQKQAKCLQSWH